MNRIAKASLCLVLTAVLAFAGCSTSWIKIALADLPVITQVALNIAAIVAAAQTKDQAAAGAAAQIRSIANQVQSDLALAENLINAYQKTPAASRDSTLGQISTALAGAQSNLKSILTAVHVSDATLQSTIAAAVGVALSTLASIASLVPQQGPSASASAAATSSVVAQAARPVPPPSASQLKREFNAIFASSGFPQLQLK